MRVLVRWFDALLRRLIGVYEFPASPQCIFRLRRCQAPRDVVLPKNHVLKGTTVLELHLWSERVPPIPRDGPTLAWGLTAGRLITGSLREVAQEMRRDPQLASVAAVVGITVVFSGGVGPAGERLFQRLGFTILPYHRPMGRFGEFWENLYTWTLMWTYNAASLRHRRVLKLQRSEFWMAAEPFLHRYG